MTEYWKSQARKYCEFCKCWLADNQVSISFHENGKRHKENVQKHIKTITKKSAKDFKQKEKVDDEIKKMEQAAMASYMKDVQNNGDLTSQSINELLGNSTVGPTTSISTTEVKPPPVWQEVKSDDGHSYYWNTETNDSSWDPPDEYLSLAQQEEQKLKDKEYKKAKEYMKKQKQQDTVDELKAFAAREKMKERAVKKEEKKETPLVPTVNYGPSNRTAHPYGAWIPVYKKPEEKIDLQLPKVEAPPPPPVIMEPEIIQFKEKKIDSLGEGHVDFKKRKLNSNFKRNMRQKTNDDS